MRTLKSHPLLKSVNLYLIDSVQSLNLSYLCNFASLLAFCLAIQIVTGVTLAMHYNPSVLEAFNSVEHIMRDVNNGWLIRYLHSNTASAFFFLVYLHIGRGLYCGSYKAPKPHAFVSLPLQSIVVTTTSSAITSFCAGFFLGSIGVAFFLPPVDIIVGFWTQPEDTERVVPFGLYGQAAIDQMNTTMLSALHNFNTINVELIKWLGYPETQLLNNSSLVNDIKGMLGALRSTSRGLGNCCALMYQNEIHYDRVLVSQLAESGVLLDNWIEQMEVFLELEPVYPQQALEVLRQMSNDLNQHYFSFMATYIRISLVTLIEIT